MAGKREAPRTLEGDEGPKKQKMNTLNESENENENRNSQEEELFSSDDEELFSSNDDSDYYADCDSGDLQLKHVPENEISKPPPDIQMLMSENLEVEMRKAVREVEQKLEVSASDAYLLLNHFSWDADSLYENYYDNNREEYFRENGLPYKTLNPVCRICFFPFRLDESIEYPQCGHHFCSTCLIEYVKTRISENGIQSSIQCPETGCNILLKEDYIKNVIRGDVELVKRYDLLLVNDYVSRNNCLKYCPGERCGVIWKVDLNEVPWNFQEVVCNCRESYCFSCNKKWHFPLDCKLNEHWSKMVGDPNAGKTSSWILANTKPCPTCSTNIQKSGGCDVVACKKCGFKFCWVCLTPWAQHGYFFCNPVKTAGEKVAENIAKDNHRFLIANERFLAHDQSYNLEKKLLEGSQARMDEIRLVMKMEQLEDASFYSDAIKGLLVCRKLLQYSFPFVYYLERNSQVEIFEANMATFQDAVKTLSDYFEQDMPIKKLGENKLKILNMTNFCKQRRKLLIEHVNEGYAGERWNWIFRKDLNFAS